MVQAGWGVSCGQVQNEIMNETALNWASPSISLLERDPATYSIVSLRPLSSVAALVRSLENTQLFTVQVFT